MMRATVVRGERGSVLLSALVLVFVITTLGLALFELSFVESRSRFNSQSDARAFEIAQAGVERALERLLQTILNEPRTTASWADGDSTVPTAICTGGCVATGFRAAASSYISNTAFDGGSYAISFQLLTVADASSHPYGQRCLPDTTTTTLCANLIFVRSTGTVAGLPGYAASRTIQLLAQAKPPFSGVTAGANPGGIKGNACIAGSINVIGDPGTASLSFGKDACQGNNWAALDSASLARLNRLQPVCPPGRTCPPDAMVYSLGATLKVALPTTIPAVVLSSTAYLGQSQATADSQTAYHSPPLHGKGPLDAIFAADGCVMPCTDNFTSVTVNSNTVVDGDNITRPYPSNPLPSFPLLTDPVAISGGTPSSYAHYACPSGSSCFGAADEFFLHHAADLTTALSGNLGSAGGLTDGIAAFTVTFAFTDKTGTSQTGQICWRRATGSPAPPALTLEFGSPNCDTPTTSANPLLVYMNSNFTIKRTGGPDNYFFRGVAIFLVAGVTAGVPNVPKIEENWYPCQTTGAGTACLGQTFPENHLFAVLTPNRMEIDKDNPVQVNAIFGFFYTASDFYSEGQTNIVGSMTALRFCFGSGGCPLSSGVKVPSVFEVPYDPRTLPAEMFVGSSRRWAVSSVLGFWLECRPGATPTVPATVTGICGYS